MSIFFDIIVAHNDSTRLIGKNQTIPWRIKEDLEWFKRITTLSNSTSAHEVCKAAPALPNIILGRRTWESLPNGRPLPGRCHWIVSKTLSIETNENLYVVPSLEAALKGCAAKDPNTPTFVIGGEALYKEALRSPWCRRIYETVVFQDIPVEPNDTAAYFPVIPPEYHRVRTGAYQTTHNGIRFHHDLWERKRPILWWIDRSCYESDWLAICLADVPSYNHTPSISLIPNAIIIANQLSQYRQVFELYETHRVPYALIHLSDEYLDDDTRCYSHTSCTTVFRNYLHPIYFNHPKVIPFGIGYRNQFSALDARETCEARDAFGEDARETRTYIWSFAGYLKKSDRTQIAGLFQCFQPYFIHETTGFNQGILSPDAYARIMHQSQFVLCPIGNCSLDTFRLYEALEAGAIPITLTTNINQPYIRFVSHYWATLFGTHDLPWIISPSWEENVSKVRYYLNHPDALTDLKNRATIFWTKYKHQLRDTFKAKLSLNVSTP